MADDKKAASATVACIIMRDRWDEQGNRVSAGEVIEVSAEEAMDGIENGTLERVKAAKA